MVFAGQDAWRKHPMLANCYKRPFPGLGIALGIFAGYCIIDGTIKIAARESTPHCTKKSFISSFAYCKCSLV